jgi:hypothetical protein
MVLPILLLNSSKVLIFNSSPLYALITSIVVEGSSLARFRFGFNPLHVAKTSEMIRLEVSLAVKDVLFYGQKVHTTSEVGKTLESVVEGGKTRFEIGQIDNDELLYAQGLLTDAKIEKLKAIITYNLKLTELSKAQGTLLSDLGISLQ